MYASRGGGWYNISVFFIQADGEAEALGCIKEAVDDVLFSFLCVGEKGAVVSKQQLSDEFLNGFRACEETPKVDHMAVYSETDVIRKRM